MERFSPDALSRAAAVRLLLLDVDGVLTDGTIYLDDNGVETKGFHIGDGLGLNLLRRAEIGVGIITGRSSGVVACRARELDIRILVQGCSDKLGAAREIVAGEGLTLDQVAYMGDDLIDLPLLRAAALSLSVPDGAPEVRAAVHHVTRAPGGKGAVREACELILKAQGQWERTVRRYQ